jgi:hypothetical protein
MQVVGSDDELARARMASRHKTTEVVVGRSFEEGRWVTSGLDLGGKYGMHRITITKRRVCC